MADVIIRLLDTQTAANRTAVLLHGERSNPGDPITIKKLQVLRPGPVTVEVAVVGAPQLPALAVEPDGPSFLRFRRVPQAFSATFTFTLAPTDTDFLGVHFDVAAGVEIALRISLGPEGTVDSPIAEMTVTGRVRVAGTVTTPVFAPTAIAFRCVWDELPTFPTQTAVGLEIVLPGDLPWPRVRLPFNLNLTLPAITDTIRIPAYTAPIAGLPLTWGWDAVLVSADATKLTVEVVRLRVKGLLDLFVSLRFRFTATDMTLDVISESGSFDLSGVAFRQIAPGCFGVDATTTQLAKLAGLFTDEVSPGTGSTATQFQVRIHVPEGEFKEFRLDWTPPGGGPLELPLPGFQLELPAPRMLSLVAKPLEGDDDGGRLVLAATFEADAPAKLETTFGWPLDENQQEKLPDGAGKSDSLLALEFKLRRVLTVALFDIPIGGGGGPKLLRRLTTPMASLDLLETDLGSEGEAGEEIIRGLIDPCPDTPLDAGSFTTDDIDPATVTLTLPKSPFTFPFLNGPIVGGDQLLEIVSVEPLADPDPHPDPNPLVIKRLLKLRLTIGSMKLEPAIVLTFDVERMAFRADLKSGIPLTFADGKPREETYLGLKFTFTPNENKEAFILVIDGRNYAIRQAPGAVFTVGHDKATMPGDRIEFAVRDFAISPKGLSLTASITDKPARLNGLETQFRFTDGVLQISEGRIAGFTIAGAGPLPPALVGDAVAEIALQFAQVDDVVQLVRGSAKIRGPKLLSCKATRFEFELDAIGLNFVREGGADHLYFTLSGKARYKLQGGDDTSGPLAWLPGIEIQLVDCPLTGNARVIAKHVRFLIELPKKVRFSFLGCFTMELRAIGFVPQFDKFGDDSAAMRLSGQILLGDTGDVIDAKIDLHDLFVALPKPGDFIPRLYLKSLGIRIAQGDTFALEALVDFYNGEEIEPGINAFGFVGEGSVTIKGLPAIAASMAWLRVSRDGIRWSRAWFIYLEARRMSLRIPVVEIYIREIGFGFGYRYTLAAFKAVDETADVRKLLKKLKEISRTQGNLSKRTSWRVDLENDGEDPRWTVAMRALFASSSAQASPFNGYDATAESVLPSLYILDAVLAVRSDLTFFLAGRAWLNTNYHDFHAQPGLNESPLLSGFMMLSPKQSRFLANLSSNPNAQFGDHPPLPEFVKELLRNSQFTATLLIEPSLLHYELGWPNQLQANLNVGPLTVQVRAGQIFRLSTRELVVGQSYLARGRLELKAEFSAGFFGAGLYALADVAYGIRYIGVLAFDDPVNNSAFYGAVGLDIRVVLRIEFWLRIKIGFFKISIDVSLSFELQFTAALQIGISFPEVAGALGTATISIRVMGRRLGFNVRVGINDGAVESARAKTERFLKIGLEAEDVEAVPGTEPVRTLASPSPVLGEAQPAAALVMAPVVGPAAAAAPLEVAVEAAAARAPVEGVFHVPQYVVGVAEAAENAKTLYLVLVPRSPTPGEPDGFLPVPPTAGTPSKDFEWTFATKPTGFMLEHWRIKPDNKLEIVPVTEATHDWKMPWDDEINATERNGTVEHHDLRKFHRYAYRFKPITEPNGDADPPFGEITPTFDPETYWLPADNVVEDARVNNPSTAAFDAAVRGAAEQFAAPYFKFDPNSEYDRHLREACRVTTSVYTADGAAYKDPKHPNDPDRPSPDQSASELRSSLIQAITRDFFEYAANPSKRAELESKSQAFRFGLMFRIQAATQAEFDAAIAWIDQHNLGTIRQRNTTEDGLCDDADKQAVHVFNRRTDWFSKRPPEFARVRKFEHANTVAIDWRLEFPSDRNRLNAVDQDDPEHHLRHYVVRREHLDGNDPPATFTLKPAEVLHRIKNDDGSFQVLRLPPRFQLVDHFADQTSADVAALTASGKLYVYTITPIDLAGTPSPRPLTVVARRFPADPPLVPSDGELIVDYVVPNDLKDLLPPSGSLLSSVPKLRRPHQVQLRFSDPVEPVNRPPIPVGKYRVIFRREAVLPVGFYGADENVRGANARGLAISNARPLRTDIVLEPSTPPIDDPSGERADSGRRFRLFKISVDELKSRGIFPGDGSRWNPEGWTVFLQTETQAGGGRPEGVRSALAPVSVRMQFGNLVVPQVKPPTPPRPAEFVPQEVRRFTRLEWLPNPVRLDLLPPVDTAGDVGFAKVPMPKLDEPAAWELKPPAADANVAGLRFEQHPARLRAVKVVWNQGPSGQPEHPLDLHARYQVYEFDAFANPGDVLDAKDAIDFPAWSANAELRAVQEVDLLPSADLPNLPASCRDPQAWEAWHPATARRLLLKRQQQANGQWPENRDVLLGPWYSFRDSYLQWPDPTGLATRDGRRLRPFHPFLEDVAAVLGKTLANQPFPEFDVEFGPQPARGGDQPRENVSDPNPLKNQPGALGKLIKGTAPDADPYGWGLLQQMGLAAGVRLRARADGRYLNGAEFFSHLHGAIDLQTSKKTLLFKALDPTTRAGVRLRLRAASAGVLYRLSGSGSGPAFELPAGQELVTPFVDHVDGSVVLTVWGDATVLQPQDGDNRSPDNGVFQPVFESKPFLHVEHLFQPGRRTKTKPREDDHAGGVEFDATLAVAQISLRPALQQRLRYQRVEFSKLGEKPNPEPGKPPIPIPIPPNTPIRVTLRAADATASFMLDTGRPETPESLKDNIDRVIDTTASASGRLAVLVRAFDPSVTITALNLATSPPTALPAPTRISFSPTDWAAVGFTSPPEAPFVTEADAGRHWDRFAVLLRGVEPSIDRNELDPSTAAGKKALPELLAWLDRFFGTGGDVEPNQGATVVATKSAHWIASGYPRSSSPLPLTPDRAGRLTYYRSIESLWGQAYRYYVRPRGRYELLWEELGRSDKLVKREFIGQLEAAQKRLKAPDPGGVDVVFSRIRPLAAPLVLSSRRLDKPVPPGTNSPPGRVWEILLAEHPEQDLIDKNRTLVHRLEYRQTAQALFRTFVPGDVRLDQLAEVFRRAISRRHHADDPNLVPPNVAKVHLFFGLNQSIELDVSADRKLTAVATLINAQAGTTGIKARVSELGSVNERVLVLEPTASKVNLHLALRTSSQPTDPSLLTTPIDVTKESLEWPTWENSGLSPPSLPVVPDEPDHLKLDQLSPEDAVTLDMPLRTSEFSRGALALQYDTLPFYYRHRMLLIAQAAAVVSPITPVDQQDFEYISARVVAQMDGAEAQPGFVARSIRIPLARLWDGLADSGQASWPIEDPATVQDSQKRRPGALVDPAVIYAVAIERPGSGNVQVVAEYRFDPSQVSGYESRPLPGPFRGVAVRVHSRGPKERAELETLLLPTDGALNDELSIEPVSTWRAFRTVPGLLHFPTEKSLFPRSCRLRTTGPLSADQVTALRMLAQDVDAPFADALRTLLADPAASRTASTCVGFEQLSEIHDQVVVDPNARTITWTGAATADQLDVLKVWESTSVFSRTFAKLRADLTAAANDPTVVPIQEDVWRPRPTQATLPNSLRDVVLIGHGVLGFHGIMTRRQGRELIQAAGLSPPDVSAGRRLYSQTLATGLGGGVLKLLVRRGSATAHSAALVADL